MINWGIVGLGNMANVFATSIKELDNCKLKFISSLNSSKLKSFGDRYNIENTNRFNSYEELLEKDEVDAVYISTLNNTHAELIIKAVEYKKNILCEKPMTINKAELEKTTKKLNTSNIIFLEAIAYRSHPLTKNVVDILLDEKNGKIETIETNFGFDTKKINPNSRLYNKELGGGSILDVGCYPISFLNLVNNINKKDNKISISEVSGNICKTGVDDYSCAKLELSNKVKAKIEVGIRKNLNNQVIIKTTQGIIKIPEPWLPPQKTYIEVKMRDQYYKKFVNCEFSIYANQIDFFNSMISKKIKNPTFPYLSIQDSIEIANLSLDWRQKLHS